MSTFEKVSFLHSFSFPCSFLFDIDHLLQIVESDSKENREKEKKRLELVGLLPFYY